MMLDIGHVRPSRQPLRGFLRVLTPGISRWQLRKIALIRRSPSRKKIVILRSGARLEGRTELIHARSSHRHRPRWRKPARPLVPAALPGAQPRPSRKAAAHRAGSRRWPQGESGRPGGAGDGDPGAAAGRHTAVPARAGGARPAAGRGAAARFHHPPRRIRHRHQQAGRSRGAGRQQHHSACRRHARRAALRVARAAAPGAPARQGYERRSADRAQRCRRCVLHPRLSRQDHAQDLLGGGRRLADFARRQDRPVTDQRRAARRRRARTRPCRRGRQGRGHLLHRRRQRRRPRKLAGLAAAHRAHPPVARALRGDRHPDPR